MPSSTVSTSPSPSASNIANVSCHHNHQSALRCTIPQSPHLENQDVLVSETVHWSPPVLGHLASALLLQVYSYCLLQHHSHSSIFVMRNRVRLKLPWRCPVLRCGVAMSIPVVRAEDITPEEFQAAYIDQNTPVVLSGATEHWKASKRFLLCWIRFLAP